ncbi:hypothetical protein [Lactobacillus phage LL-H]|uniref:hypothetical protein n=1 Tax=Lactococcus phage LL-H TaxID=12348 RepID=UPI000009BA14|nr:hypothetical protein LPLLH_ORF125 [Lactobacillus phage LL-H]AAC00542.1 hypothetical protein [Lactobacillus phage LL-H]
MLSLSTPSKEDHKFIELTTGVYELDYSYDNVLRWFNLVESDLPDEVKATRTFLMFVGPVDATDDDIVKTFQTVSEDVSKHPYGTRLRAIQLASGTGHLTLSLILARYTPVLCRRTTSTCWKRRAK